MTMHLERGLTTLNTKKRRSKIKPKAFYTIGWKKYNKFLKKNNLKEMDLEAYIDYMRGMYTAPQKKYVATEIKSSSVELKKETYSLNKDIKMSLSGGTKRNWKEIQERIEISKQYAIVPAYNKGPYMVVSKEDLKTAGKKV